MTRKEAIQILSTRDAHGVMCGYTSGVTEALDMAIEALSVDRPHGKWQKVEEQSYFRKDYDIVCCSVCRKKGNRKWNFCPNCGARMKGGAE